MAICRRLVIDNKMTFLHHSRVSVILPASGSGERFGSKPPKQFCKVIDRPLILHTIAAFHKCSWVDDIVVPVSSSYFEYTVNIVKANNLHKVTVIEGCPSRHRSIYAGIQHLKDIPPQVVIIHDGVRVFVEESLIRDIALAAVEHGASGVVRPLVSTVVSPDSDGFLQQSLDRSQYRASEMPQAFLFNVIKTAYEKATDFDFDYGTECLLLAMKYTGTKAKLIDGPGYLWKVTYKKDLFSAEELLKEQLLQVQVHCDACSELKNAIVAKCEGKGMKTQVISGDVDRQTQLCNSHVYVYNHFDKEKMTENTASVINGQTCVDGVHIPPAVVHVYQGVGVGDQDKLEYMRLCRKLAEDQKLILLYGVICEKMTDYSKLSELVVDILWNRTGSMSGQTFFTD